MLPPLSSPTSNTSPSLSKKEKVLKWTAITLTVISLGNVFSYLITIPFGLLTLLWPLFFAPKSILLSGPIASAFLFYISGVVALITIFILFKKKKYLTLVILETVLLIVSVTYLRGFSQIMKFAEKFEVIHPSDEAPAGILNLPLKEIPPGYSGGKGRIVKYDFSPNQHYIKELYVNIGLGGDKDIIRFTYDLHPEKCQGFDSENYEPAVCKAGPCVVEKTIHDPWQVSRGSSDVTYEIDDGGSCASIRFISHHKDDVLTQDQMLKIVDSLERVPGEYVPQAFDKRIIPGMKVFRDNIETSKRSKGVYEEPWMDKLYPMREGDCVSDPHLDIAPDGQSYVIHRPVCPNNGMSYCVENGQEEITTVPTALVEETYHCK